MTENKLLGAQAWKEEEEEGDEAASGAQEREALRLLTDLRGTVVILPRIVTQARSALVVVWLLCRGSSSSLSMSDMSIGNVAMAVVKTDFPMVP